MPAFGLEEFGLPTPRRNADTWRHFDVPGMVSQDYSARPDDDNYDYGTGMYVLMLSVLVYSSFELSLLLLTPRLVDHMTLTLLS